MSRKIAMRVGIALILTTITITSCSFGWLFRRVRIDITNDIEMTVNEFYAKPTNGEWSANLLESPLDSGATAVVLIEKGIYDLRIAVSGVDISVLTAIDLSAVEIYELSIAEGAAQ